MGAWGGCRPSSRAPNSAAQKQQVAGNITRGPYPYPCRNRVLLMRTRPTTGRQQGGVLNVRRHRSVIIRTAHSPSPPAQHPAQTAPPYPCWNRVLPWGAGGRWCRPAGGSGDKRKAGRASFLRRNMPRTACRARHEHSGSTSTRGVRAKAKLSKGQASFRAPVSSPAAQPRWSWAPSPATRPIRLLAARRRRLRLRLRP